MKRENLLKENCDGEKNKNMIHPYILKKKLENFTR